MHIHNFFYITLCLYDIKNIEFIIKKKQKIFVGAVGSGTAPKNAFVGATGSGTAPTNVFVGAAGSRSGPTNSTDCK